MRRIIIAALLLININSYAADINDGQHIRGTVKSQLHMWNEGLQQWVEVEMRYTPGIGNWLQVGVGDNPASNVFGSCVSPDGTSWIYQAGDGDGRALVTDNSSKNPLAVTTSLFYECTATVTNLKITPTLPAGTNVWVSKIAVHSMDTVNKGAVKFTFASDGTSEFYGGYIGTAPSGFGDDMYASGANAGVWVTTPGACKIIIHYKTGSVGP